MKMLNFVNKNYYILLYVSIFSVFINNVKLYIPLFALNILYVLILILRKDVKLKFSCWSKTLIIFIGWFLVNTVINVSTTDFKLDVLFAVKMLLNILFLIAVALIIENNKVTFDKKGLVKFLQFIIIINALQLMVIYIKGGLIQELLSGSLTKSSDTAYTIGYYHAVFGALNKNIWGSKLTIILLVYLFVSLDNLFDGIQTKLEKVLYSILGVITVFLILSRTSQLALIIPIIFICFYTIRNINKKYKIAIYLMTGVCLLIGMTIFFNKLFHMKFDMTDGGYTRLYIWVRAIENLSENNLFIGSGLGASADFIQGTIGRYESNVHNVFLNIAYELGLVGLITYCSFLFGVCKKYFTKKTVLKYIAIIVIPIFIIVNLQYLGYDNDLVIVFILIAVIENIRRKEE